MRFLELESSVPDLPEARESPEGTCIGLHDPKCSRHLVNINSAVAKLIASRSDESKGSELLQEGECMHKPSQLVVADLYEMTPTSAYTLPFTAHCVSTLIKMPSLLAFLIFIHRHWDWGIPRVAGGGVPVFSAAKSE